MNLTDFKAKASLSELLIIEETEKLLRSAITNEVLAVLDKNLAPLERDFIAWFKDCGMRGGSHPNPISTVFKNTREEINSKQQ